MDRAFDEDGRDYRCVRGLGGEIERKWTLRSPESRQDDNTKADHQEMVWAVWIYQAQDRGKWRAFVNTVMNLLFP